MPNKNDNSSQKTPSIHTNRSLAENETEEFITEFKLKKLLSPFIRKI